MNHKFSSELIDKFAQDLLFELTDDENKMVLDEFLIIEENMEKIQKIPNIAEYHPMTHPIELEDVVLRSDEVTDELDLDCVLQNTTYKTEEEIIVPKVVE